MTVKELIEELQNYPKYLPVGVYNGDNCANVEADTVYGDFITTYTEDGKEVRKIAICIVSDC
jgi:hypothetical protein